MGVSLDSKSKDTPAQRPESGERPPSYNEDDPVTQIALALPRLNLRSPASEKSDTINRGQCVAHLKFLAVLSDLRDLISNTEGLFGLHDTDVPQVADERDKNEALARVREKRWAVYTARAADRYAAWWFKCLPASNAHAKLKLLKDSDYEKITDAATELIWSADTLPPLDILMVWHSHMLNPRDFLEDCIRYGRMSTWRSGFPFGPVNECIQDNTLDYAVSESCKKKFEQKVQLKWDNLDDSPGKTLECPRCSLENVVLWTKARYGANFLEAYKNSTGYADNAFQAFCSHCDFKITHDRLRVHKFHQDLSHLLYQDEPMPGTLLSPNGIPEGKPKRGNTVVYDGMRFPNILMKSIGQDTLLFCTAQSNMCKSISDLRTHLEPRIKDPPALAEMRMASVSKNCKIHFRRMMSRYWDNSSPFALDLVGAVIRQGIFVQKMDKIDWLHSPTIMETADRIIQKYSVFQSIMYSYPSSVAVPTLDVDLVWHTHQLQPRRYYAYTTGRSIGTRRFIDHDDKVDENKLSTAFEWTSKMYRRLTNGGIYSECTCWYCEATRAPDLYNRLFNMGSAARARNNADELHDRRDISSDPDRNPHISAHNAVRPTVNNMDVSAASSLQRLRLQRNWQKSVRRAKKRSPQRDVDKRRGAEAEPLYYSPLVWGYPMYVPYYGPYMCDPGISSSSYACNPSCMSTGAGDVGNCCSGTCGGGVAAGSCGGMGSAGACSGGGAGASCAGGGCGGGGGGGCGGGGGGCGGGGGGCGGGGGGGG